MKTELKTREEVETFVNPLMKENKYVIQVYELINNAGFCVQWIEHKKYTAVDGKEFFDEVWTDAKGNLHLVQDLDSEHVRNILRMILRQERETMNIVDGLSDTDIAELVASVTDGDEIPSEAHISTSTGRVLH
jgi:anthranilate phosphoribosyltransferase